MTPVAAPVPLVVGPILDAIGIEGAIAVVIMVAVGAYHGRNILQLLSTVGFLTKVGLGLAVIGAIAWAGLIPGVDVQIAADRLAGAAADVWGAISDVEPFLEVRPL